MTEGDIRAKFGDIDPKADYVLTGAFIMKLIEVDCRTNPIGALTQELGTEGTQIASGYSANVVFCVDNGNNTYTQMTGQFVNGLMITLQPSP